MDERADMMSAFIEAGRLSVGAAWLAAGAVICALLCFWAAPSAEAVPELLVVCLRFAAAFRGAE
ncbi:Hypothetical predicted protein, partial [Xyrichtys novacula]